MTAALKQYFHLKSFLIGLGVVALIYVLLFVYIGINSSKTVHNLEQKLVSQSLVITRPDSAPEEFRPARENEHIDDVAALASAAPIDENALPPSPISGLYEDSEMGKLPKISDDGLTPFNAYKKPFTLPGKPLIAIAVLDYGVSSTNSAELLKDLPEEVSLILSPYTSTPDEWQKRARKFGHELWLQAPASNENFPYADPGSQALLSDAGPKYNLDRLEWILSRTTGYAGIALGTDSVFAENPPVLKSALANINKRGIGFFETNPDAPALVRRFAENEGMPYLKNTIFIRDTSLKALEKIARQDGFVVALVDPYPSSIKGLKIWANTLTAKGFALAPLSAISTLNPFINQTP